MANQQTFTDIEYAQRKRTGRREKFLDAMDAIIPWAAFEETIKPLPQDRPAGQAAERDSCPKLNTGLTSGKGRIRNGMIRY
ncbi:MAG: hypothetical protein LBQ88_08775 [Treponema sp.]|jgi:IS5 family transposase|nr:hypothetical protein [Treponema sp.]